VPVAREEGRELSDEPLTEAEFECRLAELLFGCREEGSREEIVARVDYLVDLEKTVALAKNKHEIVRAYQNFLWRLEELSEP
jgi:hypothetical protein